MHKDEFILVILAYCICLLVSINPWTDTSKVARHMAKTEAMSLII